MIGTAWRLQLAIAVTMVCMLAVPALAHGRLRSSTPAAGARVTTVPTELRLTFSEPAELAFTTVRLLAVGGDVKVGPVRFADGTHRVVVVAIEGTMGAGRHRVQWQVAGADGHPVRGEFAFVVADDAAGLAPPPSVAPMPMAEPDSARGPSPDMHHDSLAMPQGEGFGVESPPYVLVRWAGFVALLLLIGAVSFHALVLRALAAPGEAAFRGDADRGAARIGLLAAGALGAVLLMRLAAQSYALHGSGEGWSIAALGPALRSTTWGIGWLVQLAGVLLALVGLSGRRHSMEGGVSPLAARSWLLAGAGAVACAIAPPLSGHAAAVPGLRVQAIVADGVHVLAASAWLGTLAVLLVAGLRAARLLPAPAGGAMVRAMVNAFSPVALVSAALVAITGAFAAWLHVGSVAGFWSTRYGVTLLVKLAAIAGVALTGLYNWRRVRPTLGSDTATAALSRSARAEVAIAVLVLLVTAVLVATPPSVDAGP